MKRRAGTRTVIFVPERKLSETILDFAAPLLEPLGSTPEIAEARRAVELAISVWNFHVMATPLWGKPKFLSEARKKMCGPASPPGLATVFELREHRRREDFGTDYRFVGTWSFESDATGGGTLRCETRLPEGCEAYVPPAVETRISIGGRVLDEVKIRQTPTSLLSFPPERHHAEVSDDHVVIHVPAYVAVQLLADGTLPPARGAAVEVVVYAQPPRLLVLAEVRASSRSVAGDVVSLVFELAR